MSIELIKELRNRTGAGISDCKKAIEESKGDIEEAIKWLRERGIAKAAKKAGAIAAEGSTIAVMNSKRVVVLELNSQTDFVSDNEEFKSLVKTVADGILNSNAHNLEEASNVKLSNGKHIHEYILEKSGLIGEKLDLRRVSIINRTGHDSIGLYTHFDRRISVAIVLNTAGHEDIAKKIAMHAAAMKPQFISNAEIPAEKLAEERQIVTEQIMQDDKSKGKPQNIVDKMIEGRLSKELAEICLIEQSFVQEPSKKVKDVVAAANSEVVKYIRYEVGEGIKKETVDFAKEVAEQMAASKK